MKVHRRTTRLSQRGRAAVVATLVLMAATAIAVPPVAAAASPLVRITDGSGSFHQPSVSDDGRFVLYVVANTQPSLALRDRQSGTTQQVADWADSGEISADGTSAVYVIPTFTTCDGDGGYGADVGEVYLWKRSSGTFTLISPPDCVGDTYRRARISADGKQVVWDEYLADGRADPESVWVYDATTGTTTDLGSGFGATISDNGRYIAYLQAYDQPTFDLYDRNTGTTASIPGTADSLAPVSNDGRFVTYGTESGVVSLDRTSGTTINLASAGREPDMSPDGRYVAFGGGQYFGSTDGAGIWDRTTGGVVTVGSANAGSPSVSADGTFVSFLSGLDEGVPGTHHNGWPDVYLWTRPAAATGSTTADFDGDGRTDIAVFRPSNGGWYVNEQAVTYLGLNGDVPVPADYSNAGRSDRAVWRPSTGAWFVDGTPNPTYHGLPGDVPVPGDYDGDGSTDYAVWRPSNGGWYIHGQGVTYLGLTGDKAVPADYDGDGTTELAVFRPSTGAWYVQGTAPQFFGAAGDIPLPNDYDADGSADLAIFRPSTGAWLVDGAGSTSFGLGTDTPVPGQYDADPEVDLAVFRPSTGAWLVEGADATYFGLNGDIPAARSPALA